MSAGRRAKGLTVIELVMVLVVISILLVLAAPGLENLPLTRAQFAAYKMRSDVRYAQLLALASQLRTRVVFNASANSYALEQENSPGSWGAVRDPASQGSYAVTLNTGDYEGVDITAASINGTDTVIFDPAAVGAPYDGTGTALAEPSQVELNAAYQLRFRAATGKVDIVTL